MVLVACGISLERRPYRAEWRGFRLVPSRLSVFARCLMRRICHVSSQPIKGRKEEKHEAFPPFSAPLQAPLRASIFLSIFLWEKNSKYRLATNLTWGFDPLQWAIQVLKEITISRLVHAWPTNHSIFKQRTFSWVFNSFMARILFICI